MTLAQSHNKTQHECLADTKTCQTWHCVFEAYTTKIKEHSMANGIMIQYSHIIMFYESKQH